MIRAEGEESAGALELQLDGVVGWDVYSSDFAAALKQAGDIDSIKLRINSPGGDVFEGFAIYNLLAQHKARVEVSIDGLAASAASVIAMAGDRISMAESAMFMIHNSWGFAVGNADEMRDTADLLEKIDGMIAGIYAARTKLRQGRLRDMMNAETWLTGTEAKELGFADALIPNKAKPEKGDKAAARASIRLTFRNAPVDRLSELGFDYEPPAQAERAGAWAKHARGGSARELPTQPANRIAALAVSIAENPDAFGSDGMVRSSQRAAALICSKLEAGEHLTPAERALAATWARGAEATARAENLKHAPAAHLDTHTQPRLGDCL